MVDATTAIIVSIIAGLAGGFLSSWMAFNASGQKWDGRKHGNALITGALTGMAFGLGQVIANEVADMDDIPAPQFAIGVFATFLAAAGIDRLRSSTSHMITNKATAEKTTTDKTTTTSPPPSPPSTTSTK
jgi:hypothetical protein